MKTEAGSLSRILDKAEQNRPLSTDEIKFLLGLTGQKELDQLFACARNLRERYFSNRVFLYGFVYFSTWCRNNCAFCFYRVTNTLSPRYRKGMAEILEAADRLAESGVHLIDLTSGEDAFFNQEEDNRSLLIRLVEEVKQSTGLPLMVSPGVVPAGVLRDLATAGADWYACYQETHNRDLFKKLRWGQDYDLRYSAKVKAREYGLLIEEGILAGVGETLRDQIHSLEEMKRLNAQQVRVMGFVPQPGTPMSSWPKAPLAIELKMMAVMRLSFPDRLIPASLDVDGLAGLQARLQAGANVITSLILPGRGLAGVAQCSRDIDEGYRTVQGIAPVLENLGLEAATPGEYARWVLRERKDIHNLPGPAAGNLL